jgi:hypothetical protein
MAGEYYTSALKTAAPIIHNPYGPPDQKWKALETICSHFHVSNVQDLSLHGTEEDLHELVVNGIASLREEVGDLMEFSVKHPNTFSYISLLQESVSEPSPPGSDILFDLFPPEEVKKLESKEFLLDCIRTRVTNAVVGKELIPPRFPEILPVTIQLEYNNKTERFDTHLFIVPNTHHEPIQDSKLSIPGDMHSYDTDSKIQELRQTLLTISTHSLAITFKDSSSELIPGVSMDIDSLNREISGIVTRHKEATIAARNALRSALLPKNLQEGASARIGQDNLDEIIAGTTLIPEPHNMFLEKISTLDMRQAIQSEMLITLSTPDSHPTSVIPSEFGNLDVFIDSTMVHDKILNQPAYTQLKVPESIKVTIPTLTFNSVEEIIAYLKSIGRQEQLQIDTNILNELNIRKRIADMLPTLTAYAQPESEASGETDDTRKARERLAVLIDNLTLRFADSVYYLDIKKKTDSEVTKIPNDPNDLYPISQSYDRGLRDLTHVLSDTLEELAPVSDQHALQQLLDNLALVNASLRTKNMWIEFDPDKYATLNPQVLPFTEHMLLINDKGTIQLTGVRQVEYMPNVTIQASLDTKSMTFSKFTMSLQFRAITNERTNQNPQELSWWSKKFEEINSLLVTNGIILASQNVPDKIFMMCIIRNTAHILSYDGDKPESEFIHDVGFQRYDTIISINNSNPNQVSFGSAPKNTNPKSLMYKS